MQKPLGRGCPFTQSRCWEDRYGPPHPHTGDPMGCMLWRPITITGTNEHGAATQQEEWDCAIPLHLITQQFVVSGLNGIQHATESHRNESLKGAKHLVQSITGRDLWPQISTAPKETDATRK